MILTLQKTIPSHSHNAPYSVTEGYHWPAGQKFIFSQNKQNRLRGLFHIKSTHLIVEQIGGEEVLVAIPIDQFPELFDVNIVYYPSVRKKP